jgi:hypothetical protein
MKVPVFFFFKKNGGMISSKYEKGKICSPKL